MTSVDIYMTRLGSGFSAFRSALLVPVLALTPAALLLSTPSLMAQRAVARTVDGTVQDKSGAPLKGAVVHLKDVRSLSQKSFITADDGAFRFGQLSSSTDYEVWADISGKKSPVKSISSFDSKNAFTLALKVN